MRRVVEAAGQALSEMGVSSAEPPAGAMEERAKSGCLEQDQGLA